MSLAGRGVCAAPPKQPDPAVSAIYPMAGQRGKTFDAILRGANLRDAQALLFEGAGVEARILSVTPGLSVEGEESLKGRGTDLAKVQITTFAEAVTGPHFFRVVTPRGISNRLALHVTSDPVLNEAEAALPIKHFPVVVNGQIARPGDTNSYSIAVAEGETLTFETASLSDGFDPSIALYEPGGSWFDAHRLNQVASNDDPLSFPGLSKDARLVKRFERGGIYYLRVQGFAGQGGPDCVYRLRIVPGETAVPALHPVSGEGWEERQFTRALTDSRMQELTSRGVAEPGSAATETFRAVPEGTNEIPVMRPPGFVTGRIEQPGQAQIIRLKIEKPQEIAIEVQTPEATLPRFNPVVRVMEPDGREIATDVYTKLNNNGLYMMKMIEPKTTVALTAAGEYTLEIRDITTNGAGADFVYRVMIRPQIPHVGKISLAEDHINLEAGCGRPVDVTIDREEGFGGYVAVELEGLPTGVTVLPAVEDRTEPPPLPNGGRLERYVSKQQRATLVLNAAADASPTEAPVRVRVLARLMRDGRLSEPIFVKEILMMVVLKAKS
jgi:hypothetical protein